MSVRHFLNSLALVVAALAASGCADAIPPVDTPPPSPMITVTVGPQGGRLELAAGNPLGVVRVDIPAGALTEPTEITLAPGLPDASLPAGAFPVGPYVRMEPKGLVLSVPARVTLPVYDEIRDSFGQGQSLVKAWLRGSTGWVAYEQTTSGSGFVTFETDRLDLASAGVEVAPAGGTGLDCTVNGTCELPTPSKEDANNAACSASGGYCVATLGAIGQVPLVPRLYGCDGYVAWMDLTGSGAEGTLVPHRVDASGVVQANAWPPVSIDLDQAHDTLRDRGAAFVGDALDVGLLGGLAALELGGSSFTASDYPTLALTGTGDGRWARFVSRSGRVAVALTKAEGGWNTLRTLSGLSPAGLLRVRPAGRAVLVMSSGARLLVADTQASSITIRANTATLPAQLIDLAATSSGAVLALSAAGRLYRTSVQDIAGVQDLGVDEVHAVVSDGDTFWAALNNRPAVVHLSAQGSISVVALGQAAVGSAEADAMVPRAIASPEPGVLIVLTRGAEFIRVRVATQ